MPRNKKSNKKRGSKGSSKLGVMPLLAPDKLILTMPWFKTGNDGTAAPGFAIQTLVINDIYNIDSAGVSTSRPQMFDQVSAIWQNFKVRKVKIVHTWTIANNYRHFCAFAPRRVSSAPTTVAQAIMRKGSRWGSCTVYQTLTRSATYTIADIAGPAYVDYDFTGQYNASPSKTAALDICSSPTENQATSITYFTYMEFEVEWSQRRNVSNA